MPKYTPVVTQTPEEKEQKEQKKSHWTSSHTKEPKSGTATIRTLNQLLRDVNIIYKECNGNDKEINENDSKLDEFQQTKRELVNLMKIIKNDIKTERSMTSKIGQTVDSIKLKRQTNSNLQTAKKLHLKLNNLFNKDQKNAENGNVKS